MAIGCDTQPKVQVPPLRCDGACAGLTIQSTATRDSFLCVFDSTTATTPTICHTLLRSCSSLSLMLTTVFGVQMTTLWINGGGINKWAQSGTTVKNWELLRSHCTNFSNFKNFSIHLKNNHSANMLNKASTNLCRNIVAQCRAKPRLAWWQSCERHFSRTKDTCNDASGSSRQQPAPVIICGGGIGGLTLARALQVAHVPCVVLEQAARLRPEAGNGIGLWGPALMVLRQLGLEHQLQPKGRYMQCAGYRDATQGPGEWLVLPSAMTSDEDAAAGDAGVDGSDPSLRLRSCLCIRRGDLQTVLKEALPPGCIQLGARVASVQVRAGSAGARPPLVVHLEDGSSVEGSVVVGADGVWSRVRQSAFRDDGWLQGETEPFDSGYDYWRAIANVPQLQGALAYEAWAPSRRFGMVPLAGDDVFWFAVRDHAVAPGGSSSHNPITHDQYHAQVGSHGEHRQRTQKQHLLEDFGAGPHFHSSTRDLLAATPAEAIEKTPILDMPRLKTFVRPTPDGDGAVVLLGDACHTMAPNLAQGACLAIEDAAELASQLRSSLSATGENKQQQQQQLGDALSVYDSRRRRRAHAVQRLVPLVHVVGHQGGWLRRARNALFTLTPHAIKTPVFDTTHRAALGWAYTCPNLGQGLYARLLGLRHWERLAAGSPGLQTFHSGTCSKAASGKATITQGSGWFVRLLGRVLGLPPSAPQAEVSVEVEVADDSGGREASMEVWERVFTLPGGRQHRFTTTQWVEGENMFEQHGPLQFEFALVPCDTGFIHVLQRTYVGMAGWRLRIPVPGFAAPVVVGETRVEGQGWYFAVRVHGPKWLTWLIGAEQKEQGEEEADVAAAGMCGDNALVATALKACAERPLFCKYTGTIESVKASGC